MDSYSSKHLLTGRQLRELRKKGLTSPERRRPWSARNADLIKPGFASFDADRDGKLSKAEFRDLLASINGHLSDRKVREITEVLTDGAESVDVASIAERVADHPEQSRYLVHGMRGLRFDSGETIFHTADPSDFAEPPPAGRKNRIDRWKDHGDIFSWGHCYLNGPHRLSRDGRPPPSAKPGAPSGRRLRRTSRPRLARALPRS